MLEELKIIFLPYIEKLLDFNFSITNPAFLLLLLFLFLVLAWRFWNRKKSFSFCIVIALILLGSTKLEIIIANAVKEVGGSFEPTLFRFFVGIVLLIVIGYYALIKGDE